MTIQTNAADIVTVSAMGHVAMPTAKPSCGRHLAASFIM